MRHREVLAIASLIVVIFTCRTSRNALEFQRRVRDEENARVQSERATLERDQRRGMKILILARESRGHMDTLRKVTSALRSLRNAARIGAERRDDLKYYVFHATQDLYAIEFCIRSMAAPSAEQRALAFDLRNEYMSLQNTEFNELASMGVDIWQILAEADSMSRALPDTSDSIDMAPLTTHEVTPDLLNSLLSARPVR